MAEKPAEKLTYKEIEKRYDSQWVLLTDMEVDKQDRIKRATVVWHGEDRDELHRQARSLPHGFSIATLYMGEKIPRGVVVVV